MHQSPWIISATLKRYAAGSSMDRHLHDRASLSLVVNGEYEENIRGRAETHNSGHLVFCPADEPHAQRFSRDGALKVLVVPSTAALDYLGKRMPLTSAPSACSVQLAGLGTRLSHELRHPDDFSPLVAEGLLLEMFGHFCRKQSHQESAAQWLRDVRDQLHAQTPVQPSLGALANTAGRHPVHLARSFKRAYGKTVGEYARELRVRHAAGLLRSTLMPIADIALSCGFCDQAHLSHSFRIVYGCSPSRYREGQR